MKIAIGSDHAGYDLKDYIIGHIRARGIECTDLGGFRPSKCDYPDLAEAVASAVAGGEFEMGILICGTGAGICMAANKFRGIRAVLCSEPYTAKLSRLHNDANVLCFGARVLGKELAAMIVDTWLDTEFEGGRHDLRVDKIRSIEDRNFK